MAGFVPNEIKVVLSCILCFLLVIALNTLNEDKVVEKSEVLIRIGDDVYGCGLGDKLFVDEGTNIYGILYHW